MGEYFYSNEAFGVLVIRDILSHYDYPRVFICENKNGTKYLFSESDFDEDYGEWVVIALSNGKYYKIITSQMYLKEALLSSEDGKYYLIKRIYSGEHIEFQQSPEPFVDKIPEEDTYVGSAISSKEIDTHNIEVESMKIGIPLIDFVIFPDNHKIQDIDAILLEETCSKFRILFSFMNPKKSIRVSTLPGSFVVRFNLNDPSDLFTVSNGEKLLNTIHAVFSSNKSVDVYRELSCNRDALAKYNKLLLTLKKINNDINVISSSPSNSKPEIQKINQKFIADSINSIKEFYQETSDEIIIDGILFAFDKKHKKFTMKSNLGDEISGAYIDEAYPDGFEYTIDKIYKCILEKIIKRADDYGENKDYPPKYILKKAILVNK